ncbi:MAG: hypothetical protein M1818_005627 [Claussenomyces sp. TS43310]|nr:MAG: hypothetical protein M1818_005627 [Claussenomyces sp. TS43310]
MAKVSKRARSPSASISPPPIRRRLNPPAAAAAAAESDAAGAREAADTSASASASHLRIYSWNVNGIGPFLQKPITSFFTSSTAAAAAAAPSPNSLRNFLRRHAWPQMLCLQEVKINAQDETTQRALERAANVDDGNDDGTGPGYRARYCLPRDRFNARGFGGKVYGVATLVRDDFAAERVLRTREVAWDGEGRVLLTELRRRVVVINAYWVNGTHHPWRSSETGAVVGTRHDCKRAFHARMLRECRAYERAAWTVLLVGDMNVAPGPLDGYPGLRLGADHVCSRADFNAKFLVDADGLRGVDVFRHLHGQARKYTYRARGIEWGSSCDRVDLIIASRGAVDKGVLVKADIMDTVTDRGHSDHVPLFVTLDLEKVSAG